MLCRLVVLCAIYVAITAANIVKLDAEPLLTLQATPLLLLRADPPMILHARNHTVKQNDVCVKPKRSRNEYTAYKQATHPEHPHDWLAEPVYPLLGRSCIPLAR